MPIYSLHALLRIKLIFFSLFNYVHLVDSLLMVIPSQV
jgi:hypothetical protein